MVACSQGYSHVWHRRRSRPNPEYHLPIDVGLRICSESLHFVHCTGWIDAGPQSILRDTVSRVGHYPSGESGAVWSNVRTTDSPHRLTISQRHSRRSSKERLRWTAPSWETHRRSRRSMLTSYLSLFARRWVPWISRSRRGWTGNRMPRTSGFS